MKWLSIAILIMVVFAFSPAKSAEATAFSFSVGFHDELSPYGTWVNFSNYGNVWRPYAYAGWRPYVDGYWGSTSYGPTWYGNEPYAPYVYHYGYWIFTPVYGWVWIPGNDYTPGRVNWSYGGGYIGWRPAFPVGYNYGGYSNYGGYGYNDARFWVVIDADRFGYNSYQPYAYRTAFVEDLFDRRVFRQRYDTLREAELERIVRRPIRRLDVREQEVLIGNRKAKLLATPTEEARIRKNVTEVRGRAKDRGVVERDAVMKNKFEDIRTKSKAGNGRNEVRRSNDAFTKSKIEKGRNDGRGSKDVVTKSKVDKGRNDARKSNDVLTTKSKADKGRNEVRRSSDFGKSDHGSKQKIEKSRSGRKEVSTRGKEVQKKSKEKAIHSSQSKRDSDRVKKASFSSRKQPKLDKASYSKERDTKRVERSSVRKPSKIERSSYSTRKPSRVERTSHTSVRKAEVRAHGKTDTAKSSGKRETTRKSKPRKH